MCVLVLKSRMTYCGVMSISNHLCREVQPRGYVQRQYVSTGIIPILKRVVHSARAVVHGGSAEEHRLFAELLAELKNEFQNIKQYVRDGTAESHLDTLIRKVIAYEEEFDRVHPENHHVVMHLMQQMVPSATNNVYHPQSLGTAIPCNGVYYQWVAVPCYPPFLSSNR